MSEIRRVQDMPKYRHSLRLLADFLDQHSISLSYKLRSSKAYHSVVQQVISQILRDDTLFCALEEGTLRLFYSKETKEVTLVVER